MEGMVMKLKSHAAASNVKKIDVAEDFSRYPAGRFLDEGPASGERFRRMILKNLKRYDKIIIDFDNAEPVGSSFLSESFGYFKEEGFNLRDIKKKIEIKSESRPALVNLINEYIEQDYR